MSLLHIIAAPDTNIQFNWRVADSHRLEKGDGTSVQINGDTVWSLAVEVGLADAKTYIDNRATKRVNAIIFEMIEHYFSTNTPAWRNENGDLPFSGTTGGEPDFTTPVEAYWSHVDALIDYCYEKDIMVFAFPCYIGYQHGVQGWAEAMIANGTTNMTTYGEWLGNRYKNKPNIVWVMGGDWGPVQTSDLTTHVNNLANGIKTNDPNHLMTAHSSRNNSALDDYDETWLQCNSTYSDETSTCAESRNDYQRATPLPTFLIESRYVNMSGLTDLEGMRIMYQAILHGTMGHFLGADPQWYFGTGWDTAIDSDGAQYLTYVARLQAARDLPSLTPDYSDTFVTAGKGTEGSSYSPVVADSSQLVAFCNNGANLTVALGEFSGPVRAAWFDTTDGSTRIEVGSPFTNTGSQTFNSSGDEILLIDLVSLGLGLP